MLRVERKPPIRKPALALFVMTVLSAASVAAASAHERPFTAATSFTVETSFTAETTDLSLPGYLEFVTLCGSLVGSWGD